MADAGETEERVQANGSHSTHSHRTRPAGPAARSWTGRWSVL